MPTSLHTTAFAPRTVCHERFKDIGAALSLRAPSVRIDIALYVVLLVGASFALDLLLPLGIAGGVPYVTAVLVAMWLPARRHLIAVAGVCSALTVVGFLLSAPGAPLWAVVSNRVLALFAVWAVALLALQRKRVEEALAESEAKANAVFATTAEGLLMLGEDARIISANPAAAGIFGYAETELTSRPFGELLGPTEGASFAHDPVRFLLALTADPAAPHEIVGRRKDGTMMPVEVAVVPIALPEGTCYTVTARDISARRLLEQDLLRANEEERRAVGHDLHEELGQTLTGLNLISRQLARRLERRDAEEAPEVADLATLLHEADVLALRLFETLVPVDATGGLVDALGRLANDAAHRHGVRCRVEHADVPPVMDVLHSAQLYRIVQALVHRATQDRAGDIAIRLEENGGGTLLSVHITGIDPADAEGWGPTIQPLSYRAKLIGKQLRVTRPAPTELLVACTL